MGDTDALVEPAISIDIAAQPDFRTASGFLRSVFNGQENETRRPLHLLQAE